MVEDMFMPWNASGEPLYNITIREVCTSYAHPEGLEPVRVADDGVFCYAGPGAALNDPNGTERSWTGLYFPDPVRCHYIITGAGYEIPAAKRPATRSHPAPTRVNPKTPIVWRPVAPGLDLAN